MQINLLNDFFTKLNSILKINYGGCCYVTYTLVRYCEQHNIPYSVIFADDDNIFYNVERKIINRSKNGIFSNGEYSCNHIYLKIGKYEINKNRKYNYKFISKNISAKDLLWVYQKGNWSDIYDRSNNNLLGKFLNKICDNTLNV